MTMPRYRLTAIFPAFLASLALLLSCLSGGCTSTSPAAPASVHVPPVFDSEACTEAIAGEYESAAEFNQRYAAGMSGRRPEDSYGMALANQTLGLLRNDPAYIERARDCFAAQQARTADAREKEACRLGTRYARSILSGVYEKARAVDEKAVPVTYAKGAPPAGDFHRIILGRSAIRIHPGMKIKTQVDRVTRDWLLGLNVAADPWAYDLKTSAKWTEGHILREIVALVDVRVTPVWGTKVRRFGDKWFAPDAEGNWRFEVSYDKVLNYPTTTMIDGRTVLVSDTHGISAIAWDSLDAGLVVGCGDHRGKMDAAYYLAERGVNVYCPTDRFMGLLIGTTTRGTIIGSGPVKMAGGGAVIGDQPAAIDVDETIVVSTGKLKYPLQYYDTPNFYFKALAQWCGRPLKIVPVEVHQYGKADNVVAEARRLGASVLGIRVKSVREHDAVAAWLKEDARRRAVLFHTAAYPDGEKLFAEFPRQTTFGDIHPAFE
ncbi:MAG: hypothetical protein ACE15C_12170 [Phycisphaerae bacterium]